MEAIVKRLMENHRVDESSTISDSRWEEISYMDERDANKDSQVNAWADDLYSKVNSSLDDAGEEPLDDYSCQIYPDVHRIGFRAKGLIYPSSPINTYDTSEDYKDILNPVFEESGFEITDITIWNEGDKSHHKYSVNIRAEKILREDW